MEYGNRNVSHWHHSAVTSTAPLHPPPHNDGYFFGGAGGSADYHGAQTANPSLNCAYQSYQVAAMAANGGAANGGHSNLTAVASGSGANGYRHNASMCYAHSLPVSSASTSSSYNYIGLPMPLSGGPPVSVGAPPSVGIFPGGNSQQLSPTSSNRASRNLAEKHRRDKFNSFVNELGVLVPLVANSPKKLDKTSILRLSVTFLRMQWLLPATVDESSRLPQHLLDSVNWFQMLVNQIDGSLLIVTSAGKIVYITHNIEDILGHTQLELLGLSLFNITSLEDHRELKKALTPDESDNNATDSIGEREDLNVTSSEPISNSSRSCTTSRSSVFKASSSSQDSNDSPTGYDKQRRSFFLRLSHRNPARSEQPQYELMHVQGQLMVPKKFSSQAQKKSQKNKVEDSSTKNPEIFLVAIMERLPGRRVTELSMLEPSKDEYITRHTLYGQILYSDHRISTVAGYLSEEVNGLQAFNYMHQDDAPWVAIALFQMFTHGEAFGLSCYRLRTKTGGFIYLKSYGYLEFNASTETYGSFICVNSAVSKEEGERAIAEMKRRFRPLIETKEEEGTVGIPPEICDIMQNQCTLPNTSEQVDMNPTLSAIISQVGALTADFVHEDPKKNDVPQYQVAKYVAKRMPPLDYHLENIKHNERNHSTNSSPMGSSKMSPSPPSSPIQQQQKPPQPKQERQHRLSTSSAGSPLAPSCSRMPQDRPSVLRIAPPKPATAYPVDSNLISSSSVGNCVTSNSSGYHGEPECGDCGISSSAPGRNSAVDGARNEQRLHSSCGDCTQNRIVQPAFIKQEMPDDDNFHQIHGAISSSVAPGDSKSSGANARCVTNGSTIGTSKVQTSCERIGVVVQQGARVGDGRGCTKRPYGLHQDASLSSVPTLKRFKQEEDPVPKVSDPLQSHTGSLDVAFEELTDSFKTDLNDSEESPFDYLTNLSTFEPFDERSAEVLDYPHVDEKTLDQSRVELKSHLRVQHAQINAMRNDLNDVSFDGFSLTYLDEVTQLQHEHETQDQYLQKIHQNLQRCNPDRVNV